MSEAREPPIKKLRSSEPDLVVVIGDERKEYHYHSQVMATHSKVIDAMLATSMRESQTGRIDFPDLSAEVWDSMIYFLDILTSRHMTVQDALKVAAAYDQYQFCAGANCCDQVLCQVFDTIMPDGRYSRDKKPEDLNQLIDAFLLADAANLKLTKKLAVRYFKGALKSALCRGQIIFCENQIKKLAPLIAEENLLNRSSFTYDEIINPFFPKFFVNSGIIWKTNQIVNRAVIGLRLSGMCSPFTGNVLFTAESSCSTFKCGRVKRGGDVVVFKIERLTGDWVIYKEPGSQEVVKEVWWKNPLSENMPLPPESGWVPADKLATGELKIEYLYRRENNDF